MKYSTVLPLIFFLHIANAQPGSLDESFADEGKKVIYTGGNCLTTAVQQDGKLLLAGSGGDGHTMIRLLENGTIDSSFGDNGFSILSYAGYGGGSIVDIKLLSDKKIIAAINVSGPIMLARFQENGNLDSTFGVNGTFKFVFSQPTTIFRMQIQTDGKYILAGTTNLDAVVLRFNIDGSLDETFGENGEKIISQDDASRATDIQLQPDGKIVVGGYAFNDGDKFFLARLNADGSLDQSFGDAGTIQHDVGEGDELVNCVALQTDGKIIAAGLGQILAQGLPEIMTATRYDTQGHVDTSFGTNGVVMVPFADKDESEAKAILLQPDGKIILAGRVTNNFQSYSDPAVCRLKPDGTIDSSFAINGRQITDFEGTNGENDGALQQDGKIVIVGHSFINNKDYYNALRYNNDIVMPLHFTYFNARPTNKGNITLNWQTAQENNNNYFSVERSANTTSTFAELTRVNSQGNSSQAQAYSYTDNAPLQGTNFYRLKQVDKDGKFSYSQIVSATIENVLTVVLYPNPVRDVLNIKALDEGMSYELSVMSVKGSVVAQTKISNTSSYQWNLKSLSRGVYYLSVTSSNNKTTTVKFVKE